MPEVVFERRPVASPCATRPCPATTAGTRTSRWPRWSAPAASSASSAGSGPTPRSATTTPPTTCATSTCRMPTCSRGPIGVEGAEPGDLLVVDILDLGPCQGPQEFGDAPGQGWGYTGIFDQGQRRRVPHRLLPGPPTRRSGTSTARSRPPATCPASATPASPTLACSAPRPSAELLARWNRREQALIDTRPGPRATARRSRRWPRARSPARPTGVGRRRRSPRKGRGRCRRARTAATTTSRTSPAAAGSSTRCTSTDAKLSGGDLHFSQGDGEITFCGAIEMGGFIDFARRPHQGRHGDVRGHHQPDLHARQRRAALLGVPHLHRGLRSTTRPTPTTTSTPPSPTAGRA